MPSGKPTHLTAGGHVLLITGFEYHNNSDVTQNVRERIGRVSEDFPTDGVLSFTSAMLAHVRAEKALTRRAAAGQMPMEAPSYRW